MFLNFVRWLSTLDRSYFFALSAFVTSIVTGVLLLFLPIITRFDGSEVTILEDGGAAALILLILPVFVVGSPLIALPQKPGPRYRQHKINSVAATVVLLAFVFISLPTFQLSYLPTLIMSVASSASLYFGRNRKPVVPEGAQQDVGKDGVRLSRSARRRAREQERLAKEGNTELPKGETPLSTSRKRRGRNRRKR